MMAMTPQKPNVKPGTFPPEPVKNDPADTMPPVKPPDQPTSVVMPGGGPPDDMAPPDTGQPGAEQPPGAKVPAHVLAEQEAGRLALATHGERLNAEQEAGRSNLR